MKRLIYFLILFFVLGLFIPSCKKDDYQTNKETSNPIEQISKMGFDITGIVDMGEYFLVEGDIMINKNRLKTLPRQVYNGSSGLVDIQHQNNITVRIDASVPNDGGNTDWRNEVSQAIQEYNNITNSNIQFSLVTNSTADITITTGVLYDQYGRDYTVIAAGSWPNNGAPGTTITINTNYNQGYPVSSSQKKYNMVHELGHNIAFRHTNWYGLNESPGTQVGNSPNSGTNPDPSSVFNGGTATSTWSGFSSWDMYAIAFLYPAPLPPINPGPCNFIAASGFYIPTSGLSANGSTSGSIASGYIVFVSNITMYGFSGYKVATFDCCRPPSNRYINVNSNGRNWQLLFTTNGELWIQNNGSTIYPSSQSFYINFSYTL